MRFEVQSWEFQILHSYNIKNSILTIVPKKLNNKIEI